MLLNLNLNIYNYIIKNVNSFVISAILEIYFFEVGQFRPQKRIPHRNCSQNVFFEIVSSSTTTKVMLIYVKSMYCCDSVICLFNVDDDITYVGGAFNGTYIG